ncbi:TM2 domain-containing protein [Aphelenchoides besseyi]|nr:TM2 domain-containing protein [Aphelenchoides besseyi]
MEQKVANGFDVQLARIYLTIGGVFGLHRLYLKQIPEAFVYFSTFGFFLVAPFYDIFYLPTLVRQANDIWLKETIEDEKPKPRKIPPFSIGRSFAQIIYGSYLGFLTIFLSAFLFTNTNERLGLSLLVSFAIAAGVYIMGSCGQVSCKFLNAWLAALSTSTFTIYLSDAYTCRSLLIIAVAATLNCNRNVEWKIVSGKKFELKHYMFWSSIFLTQLCILLIGFSRTVVDRQISFVPINSTGAQKTAPFGRFVLDYLSYPSNIHRLYPIRSSSVSYIPMPHGLSKSKDVILSWQRKHKPTSQTPWSNPPHTQIVNLVRNFNYELEFSDAHLYISEFHWLRHLTSFIVDCIRMSLLNEQLNRRESESNESEFPYPIRSALWRQFLIHSFELDAFVSDFELKQKCAGHVAKSKVLSNRKSEKSTGNWSQLTRSRACSVFVRALETN